MTEAVPPDRASPRWFAPWVLGVVALAVRLVVYDRYHRGPFRGFNDQPYYSGQAIGLRDGRLFIDPATGGPGAEHGPLTSVLLAPSAWLSDPIQWQRLTTIATGVASVVVVAYLGRELGISVATERGLSDPHGAGRRVGWTAGAIAALYPCFWLNDGLAMSESPAILLVSLWLWLAWSVWKRPTLLVVIGLGVVGGAAVLTRSELAVLLAVGVVVAFAAGASRSMRRGVICLAAATLIVGPWLLINVVRFEQPVLLTTNDGTTLRGANCDRTYEGPAKGSWSVFCLAEAGGVGLEPSKRSGRWRSEAFEYMADHAGAVPGVVAARLGRTLDLYGLGYEVDEGVRDERPRWGSWAGIVAFWILVPLAALGVARAPRVMRWLLLTPVAAVLLTTILFYGAHRIRAPMEPVVVLGAALTIGLATSGSAPWGGRGAARR